MKHICFSGKTLILREGALRIVKRLRDEFNERLETYRNFKSEDEVKSYTDTIGRNERVPASISSADDITCIPGLFESMEDEESSQQKILNDEDHKKLTQDQNELVTSFRSNVYYISLLATDADNLGGRGVPQNTHYLFDIKTEMELEPYGIRFISAQDLAQFHEQLEKDPRKIKDKKGVQETPFFTQDSNGQFVPTIVEHDGKPNIYTLAENFIDETERVNPGGFYFFDEVPLIKGKYISKE